LGFRTTILLRRIFNSKHPCL